MNARSLVLIHAILSRILALVLFCNENISWKCSSTDIAMKYRGHVKIKKLAFNKEN